MPLLSICIPTYNNANELKSTIDSIVEQIEEENLIEIVISDNCSMDETEAVSRLFCSRYSFIRYVRNEFNMGAGRNIYSVLNIAQGRFLWLIGDDKLLPDSISKVLSAIDGCKKPPAVVYLNWHSTWPRSYNGKRAQIEADANAKVTSNLEVVGVEAYIDLRLPYLPFMSAHIFNREYLDFKHLEQFADSNWIQLYFIFSALSKNPRSLHISHICIEDDHSSKENRQIKSDPWPSNIFTTRLIKAVLDQELLGYIRPEDSSKMLVALYDYIYCDSVTFRQFLFATGRVKNETMEPLEKRANQYIVKSMTRNQGGFQKIATRLLTTPLTWIIATKSWYLLSAIWLSIRSYEAKPKKIVLISHSGHGRVLKIARALNAEGVFPVLITGNTDYVDSDMFERVFISTGLLHSFHTAIRNFRGSVFHVVCVWEYWLTFLLILFRAGKILVDTFDVLNFYVKPNIRKTYKSQLALEKWCLTHADGLVCRDLRTNLLKKNNWKLPPRILFMDYIANPTTEYKMKKMSRDIVYLGNVELDPNSSVAYQYGLAQILGSNQIRLDIYPSHRHIAKELRQKFSQDYPATTNGNYLIIHDTITPKKIPDAITGSSYGLLISTKAINFHNEHETYLPVMGRYFFASKVFDYYESSVFPITQKGLFISFVMRRMGVGVTVESYNNIVDFVNKNEAVKVVFKYNKTLTVEYNAPRLMDFYGAFTH